MKRILLTLLFALPFISLPQVSNADCFCVALARTHSALVPRLDAELWPLLPLTTRTVPTIGGQILIKYETQWDVATIMGFGLDGFELSGVDFETCGQTRRILSYNDPRIYAFFRF